MTTRDDIVNEARAFLGTPFHHQGRLQKVGVDCFGLVVGVVHNLLLPGWEGVPSNYAKEGGLDAFTAGLDNYLQRADVAQHGSVLSFWYKQQGHVAILACDKPRQTIIHAYSHRGSRRVIEVSYDKKWRRRLTHIYDIPGVT